MKTNNLLFEPSSDGLTKEDVLKIKWLHKHKKVEFNKIKIYQTLPFAPFLFLGALLTILFGESFITFLVGLL